MQQQRAVTVDGDAHAAAPPAEAPAWGKAQILQRADRMADRIVKIWPGPEGGPADESQGRDWSLTRACATLPPGTWTTYGDLAELIGSHPVPVGVRLATHPVPNAWRVLMADGTISPNFRWEASDRTGDPEDLLESEGIAFTNRRADPAQRITAIELAGLLGMDAGEQPGGDDTVSIDSPGGDQFLQQLTDAHPDCVEAVTDLLGHWQSLGGVVSFGRASETSCFLLLYANRITSDRVWPFTIYPKWGSIEVGFQYMRRRPVFDDPGLRGEFRQRLQSAGISIPASKLSLRPSFGTDVLRDPDARAAVKSALEWFAVVFRSRLAQAQQEEPPDLGAVLGLT